MTDRHSATSKVRVHAQNFRGTDANEYRLRYLAGLEPEESPYGFHRARSLGFDVTLSRDARRPDSAKLPRVLRKIFGFDVAHAYANRDLIAAADVVWAMTEGEGFAIALLVQLGVLPRKPMVVNTVWLMSNWQNVSPLRRKVYQSLARQIDVLTVHSRRCLPIARSAFKHNRTELMYFGVNTEVFQITPPTGDDFVDRRIRIFAAGNDRTRDWDTLLLAFGSDDRFDVTIICPWLSDEAIARYANVSTIRNPTMADFRRCYEYADVVVVPMLDNAFSGITVALEATALGKPVISTETGGVPTYFARDEVLFTPVGNPDRLRSAVLSNDAASLMEYARRAQARFLESDYSTQALMTRYASITEQIMQRNV